MMMVVIDATTARVVAWPTAADELPARPDNKRKVVGYVQMFSVVHAHSY